MAASRGAEAYSGTSSRSSCFGAESCSGGSAFGISMIFQWEDRHQVNIPSRSWPLVATSGSRVSSSCLGSFMSRSRSSGERERSPCLFPFWRSSWSLSRYSSLARGEPPPPRPPPLRGLMLRRRGERLPRGGGLGPPSKRQLAEGGVRAHLKNVSI